MPTGTMISDLLTKAVQGSRFRELVKVLQGYAALRTFGPPHRGALQESMVLRKASVPQGCVRESRLPCAQGSAIEVT